MRFPLTTGLAARALGTAEPRLNDLVRRRKIDPPPPVTSGRRLWSRDDLLRAAEALGLAYPELPERLSGDDAEGGS